MFLDLGLFSDEFFSQTSYFQELYSRLINWGYYPNTSYITKNPFLKVRASNDCLFPITHNQIPANNPISRSYKTFFTLFELLDSFQKERAIKLIKYLIGSSLQLQEWGAIYHAKMQDRHAWHYYIDTGNFPPQYPLPECRWMKSAKIESYKNSQTIEAKIERFNRVLDHLYKPDIDKMNFSATENFFSPIEFYFLPWSFDKSNYLFDPVHDLFELPLPHELGLIETNIEHSKKTYTLRNNVRKIVIEHDDNEVINCVFSHPDVQDNLPLLQLYMGLCEGEHERYFTYKTLKSIRNVISRGLGNFTEQEVSKKLGTLSEDGILPFHPTILEDVTYTIEKHLSPIQKKRFLGLEDNTESINLRAIARHRLSEILITGKYSSALKKFERLAIFVALLGEYAYQESYVLLSCNELFAVETILSSAESLNEKNKKNKKNFSYNPNTKVAFPGSGALPLTAIFKHIMTDATIILIDKDSDALKKAKAFINWLVVFEIVKKGKIICADACSAEDYFSQDKIISSLTQDDLENGETVNNPSNEQLIDVVELAALLPDTVKYKVIQAISRLPEIIKPTVLCCRTGYGKTLCIYEKTPRLPFCLHYNCLGSTIPKHISSNISQDFNKMLYYNHQPRIYVFAHPSYTGNLTISKTTANEFPLLIALQEEAKDDLAYNYLCNMNITDASGSQPIKNKKDNSMMPNDQAPIWAVRVRTKYIKHTHTHFHDDLYHGHEHYDRNEDHKLHLHMHEHIHEY